MQSTVSETTRFIGDVTCYCAEFFCKLASALCKLTRKSQSLLSQVVMVMPCAATITKRKFSTAAGVNDFCCTGFVIKIM